MAHIQIRNVPEDVHSTLKARAAAKGMSLSEYLLEQVTDTARLPTLEDHVARVRRRPMVHLEGASAELIREAREERERQLDARR
ncbi:MAG: FitA-like ribbon-helix-helix domain-containing protein [Gaiellaceae bacterium]